MASSRLPTLLLWKCSGTDRNSISNRSGHTNAISGQPRKSTHKASQQIEGLFTSERNHDEYMHLEKVSCNTIDCYMKSILALWSATTTTTTQAQVLIKRHLVCKLPSYGHMSMSSFSKTSARRGWELPDKLQIQSGYDMIRLCPQGTGTTEWDSTKTPTLRWLNTTCWRIVGYGYRKLSMCGQQNMLKFNEIYRGK